MPWPLVAGAALMAGGTAASMFGQSKKDKATSKAMKAYKRAQAQRAEAERQALLQEQGMLTGLASERQQGIGSYLDDLQFAERPGSDQGFAERNTGMLTDLSRMTPDAQPLYEGGPSQIAQAGQDARTGADNKSIAEGILADYTDRQIQEQQQNAGHRMTLADLLRSTRGKSSMERMRLAKALRDLDWQRKTGHLQSNLDRASRKGDTLNMLGGLGTKLGGMMMSYGVGGADSGGGVIDETPMGGWASQQEGLA